MLHSYSYGWAELGKGVCMRRHTRDRAWQFHTSSFFIQRRSCQATVYDLILVKIELAIHLQLPVRDSYTVMYPGVATPECSPGNHKTHNKIYDF